MILAFLLVILTFTFILPAIIPEKVIYIRHLTLPVLCLLFIICIVVFSRTAVNSALNGLILWSSIVVPSLFPFFVASDLMNSTGFTRAAGSLLEPVMRPLFNVPGCASFALALGVTSGYPVGAKLTADLRNDGSLSKHEAERLLAFTNNSGPLFIIGAVGTGMFGSPETGVFLFVCHLLSCLTVGFIFRFYKGSPSKAFDLTSAKSRHRKVSDSPLQKLIDQLSSRNSKKAGFGEMLGNAVKNSVSTLLVIGGFIVLFSVIIGLLDETGIISLVSGSVSRVLIRLFPGFEPNELITGLFGGLLEITAGSRLVSQAKHVPLQYKLSAVSFLLGWAGVSVHFQVISFISRTDVDFRPYLLGKLIQGITACLYTLIGIRLFKAVPAVRQPVLGTVQPGFHDFLSAFYVSAVMLCLVLVLFLLIGIACMVFPDRRAKKKSST